MWRKMECMILSIHRMRRHNIAFPPKSSSVFFSLDVAFNLHCLPASFALFLRLLLRSPSLPKLTLPNGAA
ncbi:hypothetical protein MRB53_022414 [Persea americana]|uniref:Uncharacterized protein n=1 Tax=Persea americana TaxID=3435 RepID=A0ACC2L7D3_PERAE|nr:hypothetical protein MRB53_022414 [Persea americana]